MSIQPTQEPPFSHPVSAEKEQSVSPDKKIVNLFTEAMRKIRDSFHGFTTSITASPIQLLIHLVQLVTLVFFAALLYLAALALLI